MYYNVLIDRPTLSEALKVEQKLMMALRGQAAQLSAHDVRHETLHTPNARAIIIVRMFPEAGRAEAVLEVLQEQFPKQFPTGTDDS